MGLTRLGINIIVDQNTGLIQQSGFGADPSQGGFGDPNDPFGGGLQQVQEDTEVNIAQEVTISIDPALRNVTLKQLLEIIMKVSNIPIKYSVEDWGIIFSHAPAEGPRLETRTYRVDPDTFIQGLQSVGVSYVSADSGQGGGGMGGGGGGMWWRWRRHGRRRRHGWRRHGWWQRHRRQCLFCICRGWLGRGNPCYFCA